MTHQPVLTRILPSAALALLFGACSDSAPIGVAGPASNSAGARTLAAAAGAAGLTSQAGMAGAGATAGLAGQVAEGHAGTAASQGGSAGSGAQPSQGGSAGSGAIPGTAGATGGTAGAGHAGSAGAAGAFTGAPALSLEAELATLNGVTAATTHGGFSGTGYVTMAAAGSLTFQIAAPQAGSYALTIRASTPNGNKNQKLSANGSPLGALVFPSDTAWFDQSAGRVVLQAGSNTLTIEADWGWMEFDRITLTQVPPHDYSQVVTAPVDAQADAATRKLYDYLRSQYGASIIAGQTAYWTELIALASKTPAQRAFDMQNYSPHNPWHTDWSSWDDGSVKDAIDWYASTGNRGLVSFQWHWFSPSEGALSTSTFYTDKTTFDVTRAVQAGTAENTATLRDIDAIATQLLRLQAAFVPVLWRPLHEAGGGWFWWGAKGPAAAKTLYNMMYDRLTGTHGLHNLLWVWSSPEANWYPGDDRVDILGYDSYPGAYQYGTQKPLFDQLFEIVKGKKLIAMTENGPIPDIDKCFAEDAPWAYFSSWSDLVQQQNTTPHIQAVYAHPRVVTLDRVPARTP